MPDQTCISACSTFRVNLTRFGLWPVNCSFFIWPFCQLTTLRPNLLLCHTIPLHKVNISRFGVWQSSRMYMSPQSVLFSDQPKPVCDFSLKVNWARFGVGWAIQYSALISFQQPPHHHQPNPIQPKILQPQPTCVIKAWHLKLDLEGSLTDLDLIHWTALCPFGQMWQYTAHWWWMITPF